jgi:hypothetical protein
MSNVMVAIGTSSNPTFNEFLSPALYLVGIFVGALIIVALWRSIVGAFERLIHGMGGSNRYDQH